MGTGGREPRIAADSNHRSRGESETELISQSSAMRPPAMSLPYRPCVGVMVFNRAGNVFVGRRIDGPEHADATHVWQMPQGGIDPGEQPWPAALRELHEETNITSVERIGEIAEWLSYDIPREFVGQAWKGKYGGQTQKWFALRFLGNDDEIDIAHPAGVADRQRPRPRGAVQAPGL
jgi:putative (di)nucleoside polyphosphate hydrolase